MAEDIRKPGHYWVAMNYGWIVAVWDGYSWKVPGNEKAFLDGDFRGIDEKEVARER